MRWGRSYGGVSRGVVEALDGEMSLLPAASFQLLSGVVIKTTVDHPVYCFTNVGHVKWELNKFILCYMSAFEQEYRPTQVCLHKLLAVK